MDLSKRSELRKLTPQREPYWQRVEAGLYVGYRKLVAGDGTWIARRYDAEEGKQRYRALKGIGTYDAAVRAARDWSTQLGQGVEEFDGTVADACRDYVAFLRVEKSAASAADAEGRFNRLVYGASIGRRPLAKVNTKHVREWLHGQVDDDEDADDEDVRRSKDSANRNLHSLKAALNLALKNRIVATDAGWKTVTAFQKVGRRREGVLTLAERQALLKACKDDLRRFVKAMLLTGARPGEIAAVTAADFDKAAGTLGLTGKTGRRVVTLSTAARDFFAEQARDRIGNAPLLTRSDGSAWNRDVWKKQFRTAVAVAGLPTGLVTYNLRHTAISELIAAGMDSFLVAKLAGTSTAMIDRHYGHLQHDKTRTKLDTVRMV